MTLAHWLSLHGLAECLGWFERISICDNCLEEKLILNPARSRWSANADTFLRAHNAESSQSHVSRQQLCLYLTSTYCLVIASPNRCFIDNTCTFSLIKTVAEREDCTTTKFVKLPAPNTGCLPGRHTYIIINRYGNLKQTADIGNVFSHGYQYIINKQIKALRETHRTDTVQWGLGAENVQRNANWGWDALNWYSIVKKIKIFLQNYPFCVLTSWFGLPRGDITYPALQILKKEYLKLELQLWWSAGCFLQD